jgi:hypothetical protein
MAVFQLQSFEMLDEKKARSGEYVRIWKEADLAVCKDWKETTKNLRRGSR